MVRFRIVSCALISAAVAAAAGAVEAQPRSKWVQVNGVAVPQGSYIELCRELRVAGPSLQAVCRAATGEARRTSIGYRSCLRGDIAVQADGRLACRPASRG